MPRRLRPSTDQLTDLTLRAQELRVREQQVDAELRREKLRLAANMAAKGMTMQQIGDAFGVTRARAHQMVHARSSGRKPKTDLPISA